MLRQCAEAPAQFKFQRMPKQCVSAPPPNKTMNIYKDIIIFLIGLVVIYKAADFFTDGAAGIAKAFGIPRIVIGLTIVSIATTFPEFTVSAIASYMKSGGMAVGNALGSCIANIGLILALAAIIRPIKLKPRVFKQELPFLIFAASVLYFLMLDNRLSRPDGIFLFFLLLAFFGFIILRGLKEKSENKEKNIQNYNIKKDSFKFLIGALGVVLSAKYAILPSGINIARFLGVQEIVIGLSMVAVGTSLPELFTAIVASAKKMEDIAVGNVIGANILNILWVLGFASLVNPLNIDLQTKNVTMPVVFLIVLFMFLFSRTKLILTRNEGLGLLIIYVAYIFYIFKFAYS